MPRIILAAAAVLAIIFVVPVMVYGLFTLLTDLKPPDAMSPWQFLISILVSKTGTALAFVLIFHRAGDAFRRHWLVYALLWWLMFLAGEIGQAMGPAYSLTEAIAGVVSETIYIPLSALVTRTIMGRA